MTRDGRRVDPTDEPASGDARSMPGAPDPTRNPVGRPADRGAVVEAPPEPAAVTHPANRSETQDPSTAVEEPRREDETTEPG